MTQNNPIIDANIWWVLSRDHRFSVHRVNTELKFVFTLGETLETPYFQRLGDLATVIETKENVV